MAHRNTEVPASESPSELHNAPADDREEPDTGIAARPNEALVGNQKSGDVNDAAPWRRRPTTTGLEPARSQPLSAAEIEFTQAIQDYKRTSGRMFPTWSEVLEVLQRLGYHKPKS